MLKKRIITALILIPITIAILFYFPPLAFMMLISLITLMGAWEWTNLMGIQRKSMRFIYLAIITLFFILAFVVPISAFGFFIGAFVWWLFATLLIILYPRFSLWWSKSMTIRSIMGCFVLIPSWAAINFIRNQNDGVYAILFLLILIWGADSAAYFAGRKWGKHKLAPFVSPGKSVEGVMGAILLSLIITLIALALCHVPSHIWPWGIALSLITVVFSIIGDLFESMMKRAVNVKDSGELLPGHGGLLDRIDSLTAAAPTFVLGALLLGTYLG